MGLKDGRVPGSWIKGSHAWCTSPGLPCMESSNARLDASKHYEFNPSESPPQFVAVTFESNQTLTGIILQVAYGRSWFTQNFKISYGYEYGSPSNTDIKYLLNNGSEVTL